MLYPLVWKNTRQETTEYVALPPPSPLAPLPPVNQSIKASTKKNTKYHTKKARNVVHTIHSKAKYKKQHKTVYESTKYHTSKYVFYKSSIL